MNRSLHLLIVEDSPEQADLLDKYSSRAGYTVTTATNAEDALLACADRTPDVVIVDLVLPGMGGWELLPLIREVAPECAIVVTSVLDAGDFPPADAILPKPFTGAQVREALASVTAGMRLP
ncbi:MAG: response regulator [Rhodoglobus sp.]